MCIIKTDIVLILFYSLPPSGSVFGSAWFEEDIPCNSRHCTDFWIKWAVLFSYWIWALTRKHMNNPGFFFNSEQRRFSSYTLTPSPYTHVIGWRWTQRSSNSTRDFPYITGLRCSDGTWYNVSGTQCGRSCRQQYPYIDCFLRHFLHV